MSEAYQRGVSFFELRRYGLAEEELRRHLSEHPRDSDAVGLLALCRMNQLDHEGGFVLAKQAAHLAPDKSYPYYVLALFHEYFGELGDSEAIPKAETAIQEAIRICPINSHYYSVACRIYRRKKDWFQCLRFADLGLERKPTAPDCLEHRLFSLWQLQRTAEFKQAADSALEMHPDRAFAHYHQGMHHSGAGQRSIAEGFFRTSLQLNPACDDARKGLQRCIDFESTRCRLLLRFARRLGQDSTYENDPLSLICMATIAGTMLIAILAGVRIQLAMGTAAAALFLALPLIPYFPLSSSVYHCVISCHPLGGLALTEGELRHCRKLPGRFLIYLACLGIYVIIGLVVDSRIKREYELLFHCFLLMPVMFVSCALSIDALRMGYRTANR